jgi:hypothetical protein
VVLADIRGINVAGVRGFNPKSINAILAFNRGIVSKLALGRIDLQTKLPWGAEIQKNWMPRALGSMMLRPGLEYTGSTHNNAYAVHIPFVRATDDTAIIELTDNVMRVKIDETPITRPTVTSTIANGSFTSDVTSWTDADESGATSQWNAAGYLQLTGTGFNSAIRYQQITVSGGNIGVEHALNIVIVGAPVTLRVGSTSIGDNYINEIELGVGNHSLSLTPSGDFYIQFSNKKKYAAYVDSVAIASSGIMTITTPWDETNLDSVTWDESIDVLYVGCNGIKPYKIQRIGNARSWSVVEYRPNDGPFRSINISNISLTPSALIGDITLTASKALFYSTHVGALFKIASIGQRTTVSASGANQWTSEVRVIGVGSTRLIAYNLTGTWSATVTLQRSVGEVGSWVDVETRTVNGNYTYNDGLDNQIVYYRVGIDTGDYTSGTAVIELVYATGSITGKVRITGYTNSTTVSAQVLEDLGESSASTNWNEGLWSDYRGWPMAVALHEGRIWWAGGLYYSGSVSGSYESFDDDTEGDSAPIIKTIPYGPADQVNWLIALRSLLMGTASLEWSVRTGTQEEVMTAANTRAVSTSSQGSIPVEVLKEDNIAIFVQQSGYKLYSSGYDPIKENYITDDLTKFVPEIGYPGIVRIDIQRQPDTRIHAIRSDGTVAILVADNTEEVRCWIELETDGEVEDVIVMPSDGTGENKVYYCVKRTINGSTKRYLERWALESECVGGTLNKQADCFYEYSGASTPTITGLGHLEGEEVIVWANGVDFSEGYDDDQVTYTVTSGSITLPSAVTSAIIGLPYSATYKSTKLAYNGAFGTALNQRKKVDHIGLILADTHAMGLRYGPDFDNLDPMPEIEVATAVGADTVHDSYDEEMIEFDGDWDTDSRICLKAQAPRPCTVLALTVQMNTTS